jgi:SAM-dependent methyltransferase
MKSSRSGDYQLAGSINCLGGNLALGLARCVPSPMRQKFLRSHSSYQTFDETEITKQQQGVSAKKLQALQLPDDMTGKSVLDIGCSEGFFSRACAKRGAGPVLGVDTGLGRLMYGKFLALSEGLKITYKMSVFPDRKIQGKFDYILCLSVLHHFLIQKDLWKVLTEKKFIDDLTILRSHLKTLRGLTASRGRLILEMPYEYEDPAVGRKAVDFELLNDELKSAGFASARCLGTWDYNPAHRTMKDRIIYVAQAG